MNWIVCWSCHYLGGLSAPQYPPEEAPAHLDNWLPMPLTGWIEAALFDQPWQASDCCLIKIINDFAQDGRGI
jgi:hypothetical protein